MSLEVRHKILRKLWREPHRYDRLRLLNMAIAIGFLLIVPLSGLARVDVWRGHHFLLAERAPLSHALAGVLVGIAAMYVVTFLSNVVAGRLFCGWGCPVGQISRFGDATCLPGPRNERLLVHLQGAVFSGALVLSMLAWWVDLRVLWLGAPRELVASWSVVAAGVAACWAHGRFWRWEFCKTACPIGLYYSFMSPAEWYGIQFNERLKTCIECNVCDRACPVQLAPRDLMTPILARGGVSVGDAPGRNHCLECGDCVRACEWMVGSKGLDPPPLTLGYRDDRQSTTDEPLQSALLAHCGFAAPKSKSVGSFAVTSALSRGSYGERA